MSSHELFMHTDSPVFLSLNVMPSDEVVNGTTVSLNCAMDGHPTPNVSWFHNGQEVMSWNHFRLMFVAH